MDNLSAIEAPFAVLRCPRLKLKLPEINLPSPMTVFTFIFLTYFIITSGIIYDLINEPPSIGYEKDEKSGLMKPSAVMMYRLNGQYIYEGLLCGGLFCLGGIGFILLDKSTERSKSSSNTRYLSLLGGAGIAVFAYNLTIVFIKMKVWGYMQ